MTQDIFEKEAEKFMKDVRLPFDRKRQAILANVLATYSLLGAADQNVSNEAKKRVQRLVDEKS